MTKSDVVNALSDGMPGFEDAVQAQAARRIKADFIITSNRKDVTKSPARAAAPEELLVEFRRMALGKETQQ